MKIICLFIFFNLGFIFVGIGQNTQNKVVYECKTQIVKGQQHDGKNTLYFDDIKICGYDLSVGLNLYPTDYQPHIREIYKETTAGGKT